MQKVWSYIASVAIGISIGLVLMFKLMGEQVKVTIRKVKSKRNSGDTTVPIDVKVEAKRKRDKKPKKERGSRVKMNKEK